MGRQGGYHDGRGGQGHSHKRDYNKYNQKKKKTLEDYCFYVGSNKQASDYETTQEFMINHIKRTYVRGNDIAEALRKLEAPDTDTWKPTLRMSTSIDDATKAQENKQYKLDYKAEYDEFMKRKRGFEENQYKAYAELWAQCNKAMKSKIEARTDYESAVYNDPIELLRAIKEHALNYEESRYEMATIFDALKAFVNCCQKDKENIQDYTKRFKVVREVLISHLGGSIVLQKFVENLPDYDVNDAVKTEKQVKAADEQLATYIYMVNSDRDKYGSVIRGLHSQKALKNDQFPKTLVEGNNVLSKHPFDNSKEFKHRKNKENKNQKEEENGTDDTGPALTFVQSMTFAQLEGKCYCCGKAGHKSPQCTLRSKIPREEWAINKVQMAHTKEEESKKDSGKSSSATENKGDKKIGWAGVHVAFVQKKKKIPKQLKELILLDSDSNVTIFCEEKYVDKIWDTHQTMDVDTNGNGLIVSKKRCSVPLLGEHWFNKDSMTNIIALKDMTARFRVTMDSSREKAFLVHLPDKIVKFKQLSNEIYGMDPTDPASYMSKEEYEKEYVQFAGVREKIGESEVENNLKYMSERQQKRAKLARKAYQALGTPTPEDFKAMIRMNLIKNSKVTTEDINLAQKAFGPDVGALKGKTTRKAPTPAFSNVIEIPQELLKINEEIVLSIDGLAVNSLKFFTSISHEVFYRTGQYLAEARASDYEDCMQEIYDVYRMGGFKIVEIHCDNEFHKAMDKFAARQDPPIKMNYATAKEHVPRAERNNRVIQERVRANYYQLPFNRLPWI